MNKEKQKAILESVLFTMGESVEAERLAQVLDVKPKVVKTLLNEMKEAYDQDETKGITIMELDGAYQMCSKPEMYDWLIG